MTQTTSDILYRYGRKLLLDLFMLLVSISTSAFQLLDAQGRGEVAQSPLLKYL